MEPITNSKTKQQIIATVKELIVTKQLWRWNSIWNFGSIWQTN